MGGVTRVCLSVSILYRLYLFSSLLFLSLSSFSSTVHSFSPTCDWSVCSEFGECVCTMPAGRMEAFRKKTGFGVTFTHVSDTYHLLHQINMASEWVGGCI